MAGRVLAAFVHVVGEDGETVVLTPGTEVPAWAAKQITNPKAFAPAVGEPVEPAAMPTPSAPRPEPEVPGSVDEAPVAPVGVEGSIVPESDLPYAERDFKSLQIAAKARLLSGQGNRDTLIARLEADDRESAAENAAEAAKTAADVAATTSTATEQE